MHNLTRRWKLTCLDQVALQQLSLKSPTNFAQRTKHFLISSRSQRRTSTQGTTATLWLPEANVAVAAAAKTGDGKVTVNRTAKILVVDDDPLVAMSTVDMLNDLGHAVTEANSGERALHWLEGGLQIDLMVTDQAMPGIHSEIATISPVATRILFPSNLFAARGSVAVARSIPTCRIA